MEIKIINTRMCINDFCHLVIAECEYGTLDPLTSWIDLLLCKIAPLLVDFIRFFLIDDLLIFGRLAAVFYKPTLKGSFTLL